MEAVVCMFTGDHITGPMIESSWMVLPTVSPIAPWRDEEVPALSGSSFAVLDPPGIFSILVQPYFSTTNRVECSGYWASPVMALQYHVEQ